MEFIDHTGHIFTLPSYDKKPIGYEYEENKYTFWIDDDKSHELSIKNYYIRPVKILVNKIEDENPIYDFNISIDSSVFKLMGSKQIQELLEKNKSFKDEVSITESMFVNTLTSDDLLIVDNLYSHVYKGYYKTYYSYTLDVEENKYEYNYTGDLVEKEIDGIECYEIYLDANITEYIPKANMKTKLQFILANDKNVGDIVTDDDKDYIVENYDRYFTMIPFYIVGYTEEEGTWQSNIMIQYNDGSTDEFCPITIGGTFINNIEELIINGQNMGINLPKDIIKAVYQGSFYSEYPNERLYNEKLKEYLLNYHIFKGESGNFKSAIDGLKWFGYGDKIELTKLLQNDNKFQNQYIRDNFDITNDVLKSFEIFRNSTLLSLNLKANTELEETNSIDFTQNFLIGEGKPKFEDLFKKSIEVKYDEKDISFWKGYYDYTFDELGLKLCMLKIYYQKFFLPMHLTLNNVSIQHQVHMNDIKFIQHVRTQIDEKVVTLGNNDTNIIFPTSNVRYFNSQIHYIDENYNEFDNTKWLGENTDTQVYFINDTCINIPLTFEQSTKKDQYFDCHFILTKKDKWQEPIYVMNKTTLTYIKQHPTETYYRLDTDDNKYIKVSYAKIAEYLYIEEPYEYVDEHRIDYIWYIFNIKTGSYDEVDRTERIYEDTQYYKKVKPDWYYCDKIIRDTNETIIHESHFSFTQTYNEDHLNFKHGLYNDDCNYYRNFVIHPKTLNTVKTGKRENFDINYWLDSEYTLSILCNGKWFYYNFIMKLPELIINYGKLEYKYYLDNSSVSPFRQIQSIKDGKVTFNTFMWQPDLVRVNNTDFLNEVYEYCENNNLKYFDANTVLESGQVYFYTILNGEKYVFSKDCDYYLRQIDNTHPYYTLLPITDDIKEQLKDTKVYSSIDKTLKDYVEKYYLETPNFVDNKYLNRRHLVKIYKKDTATEQYTEFGYNPTDNISDIYLDFFDENGKCKLIDSESMFLINSNFDFYLMHDTHYWYGVFISKNTISSFTKSLLEFNIEGFTNQLFNKKVVKCKKDFEGDTTNNTYTIVYDKSDNELLINRLQWVDTNGINHFDRNDIIGLTLTNNEHLPFKLTFGSRWKIEPLSLGMKDSSNVESNSEMAIVSIGYDNFKYEKGYFNVTCEYSLDDYIQHNYKKKAQFKVG